MCLLLLTYDSSVCDVPVLAIEAAVFPRWAACVQHVNEILFLFLSDKIWDAVFPAQCHMRNGLESWRWCSMQVLHIHLCMLLQAACSTSGWLRFIFREVSAAFTLRRLLFV